MASVWAACAVAALVVLSGAVWTLGAVVVSRHRAAGAADLAALAAAGHVHRGTGRACAHAADLAEKMRVRVRECRFDGWDALIVVDAAVPASLVPLGPVTARARAGPVNADATRPRPGARVPG